MHLFTYGTLRFDEVWRRVVGRAFETVAGEVYGFAAYRVRGYEFPGLIFAPGARTVGDVYLDLDSSTVERLDAFEGDFYEKQAVAVSCRSGTIDCFAYVVPKKSRRLLTDELWTKENFQQSGGLERFLGRYAGFDAAESQ